MRILLLKNNFMNKKIIELELRAEVRTQDKELLKKHLEKLGVLHSQTKRLSVMYFGNIGIKKLDIRVRITNGECEIVIKSGLFGSHNRIETTQKINSDQFLGMVKIFAQLGFSMEIGERETLNYKLPKNITISLVSAGSIVYVELEKMSSKFDLNKNNIQLKKLAKQLKVKLLNERRFNTLCDRLAKTVDWPFHGTNKEYIKLTKLISSYINH